MTEEPTVGTTLGTSPTARRVSLLAWLRATATPGEAFGLPANTVRALMALVLIGIYLWMQFHGSGLVPDSLIGAVGLVTGFYLTGDASPTMKALVSMVYVGAFAAFLATRGVVPEAITAQVTTVLGMYYGRKSMPPPA